MLLVVTGIGGRSTSTRSATYEEPSFWRFAYPNLFMAAMLTLVLGDSLLTLFVGWEGVGLCSYALIGFCGTGVGERERRREGVHREPRRRLRLRHRCSRSSGVRGDRHGTLVVREIQQHAHLLADKTFWASLFRPS